MNQDGAILGALIGIGVGALISAFVLFAWTRQSGSTPPSGGPINGGNAIAFGLAMVIGICMTIGIAIGASIG